MQTSRRPFSPRERNTLAAALRSPHTFKDDVLAYRSGKIPANGDILRVDFEALRRGAA
jgi:hypothetical protein